MTWLRLDDNFADHPKLVELTEVERWRWMTVLLYCARQQTGGIVTPAAARALGIRPQLARKFLKVGLLDETENGEAMVHNFRRYNPVDPSSASRKRAYRERQRNAKGTEQERQRNSQRDAPYARDTDPTPERDKLSLAEERTDELERRAAWRLRSAEPDVRSPAAFIAAGMRSGTWPDAYKPRDEPRPVNGPVTAPACPECGIGGGSHAADCSSSVGSSPAASSSSPAASSSDAIAPAGVAVTLAPGIATDATTGPAGFLEPVDAGELEHQAAGNLELEPGRPSPAELLAAALHPLETQEG